MCVRIKSCSDFKIDLKGTGFRSREAGTGNRGSSSSSARIRFHLALSVRSNSNYYN